MDEEAVKRTVRGGMHVVIVGDFIVRLTERIRQDFEIVLVRVGLDSVGLR